MNLSAPRQAVRTVLEVYRGYSLRERLLVAVAALAVTWAAWTVTLGDYLTASEQQLRTSASAVQQRLQAALAERARLQTARATDPNQALARERERLTGKLDALNASLGDLLDHFVDPERMPALLEDVIRHHQGLSLNLIESLPAEPMEVSATPADDAAEEGLQAATVRVYRHPLRLEFEGNYFDVVAYLAELEAGPWRFGWRHLQYRVGDYPLARVTLEIETLSREKSWIGI